MAYKKIKYKRLSQQSSESFSESFWLLADNKGYNQFYSYFYADQSEQAIIKFFSFIHI